MTDRRASQDLGTKSGVFRYEGFAPKLSNFANGHIQPLLRPCSPVDLVTLNPSTNQGLPHNSPKPLTFYNHKSNDSKMDVGLLVGESLLGFSTPPSILPLVGGHSTP